MKYNLFYVKKKEMPTGLYGFCNYTQKTIYIRKDLPKCVRKSVLSHERQHEKDWENNRGYGTFVTELRGNLAGMKHPIGFITTVIMSIFSVKRWKVYLGYFK